MSPSLQVDLLSEPPRKPQSNYTPIKKNKLKKLYLGLGWGTHVNPWLIHVNVWQKPLQYCKVISLQLIKINGKKKKKKKLYLACNVVAEYCLPTCLNGKAYMDSKSSTISPF